MILNDAVLPLHDSYPGCPEDPNGLCAVETVLEALRKREAEIDFEGDCFGNCMFFSVLVSPCCPHPPIPSSGAAQSLPLANELS